MVVDQGPERPQPGEGYSGVVRPQLSLLVVCSPRGRLPVPLEVAEVFSGILQIRQHRQKVGLRLPLPSLGSRLRPTIRYLLVGLRPPLHYSVVGLPPPPPYSVVGQRELARHCFPPNRQIRRTLRNKVCSCPKKPRNPVAHQTITSETGGNGAITPAPVPGFGGGLFAAQKPSGNGDAPKPGR